MSPSDDDPWMPRRLKALAGLFAAETSITKAVYVTVKAFLDAARKALSGGVNLSAWPSENEWDALVAKNVLPAVDAAFTKRFVDVVHVFGETIDPDSYRSAFMQTVKDRLAPSMWANDTFEYVRGVVDDGVRDGDSVDTISGRLQQLLRIDATVDGQPVWDWQVQRIARTEAMAVYNGGGFNAAKAIEDETGRGAFKQWLATKDPRTRHSHMAADGQTVPLTQQFDVGGASLLFPGDPTGPANEVIQCRCTTLFLSAEEAEEHMNTQQVSEPLVAAAEPSTATVTRWRGVIAPLETLSGDGRMFAAPEGEMRVRPLPLPLTYTPQDWGEHAGAVIVGSIDRVWIEGSNVMGEGRFDTADPVAADVVRKIKDGYHRWVSAVMDSFTDEAICWSADQVVPCDKVAAAQGAYPGSRFTNWRLSEATLVNLPAFADAQIGLVDEEEPSVVELNNEPEGVKVAMGQEVPATEIPQALVAAAGVIKAPANPPREWFNDPHLPGPTPTTVTRDGHIFGHLTTWDTCHIGFPGKCVTAMPSPSGYANFHLGAVMCDNGELLPVGNLVVSTDHADLMASAKETMRHYSDSGFAAAVIRVGEDEFGPWFSGSLTPEATPEQVATLLRCPPSVDYRMINGQRDLVAALCVNVPGFPIRRERVEDNKPMALIASGNIPASMSTSLAQLQSDCECAECDCGDCQCEKSEADVAARAGVARLAMRRLVAVGRMEA